MLLCRSQIEVCWLHLSHSLYLFAWYFSTESTLCEGVVIRFFFVLFWTTNRVVLQKCNVSTKMRGEERLCGALTKKKSEVSTRYQLFKKAANTTLNCKKFYRCASFLRASVCIFCREKKKKRKDHFYVSHLSFISPPVLAAIEFAIDTGKFPCAFGLFPPFFSMHLPG